MDFKEIQELLKLINRLELGEFKMKEGEFEISVRTKFYERAKVPPITAVQAPVALPPVVATQAQAPAAPAPKADAGGSKQTPAGGADESRYIPIKSPIVGTFYRSSSPEKPAYAKVGDKIEVGSVVCIVEAMKLFNEIESEISGTIVKVMVEDAQPVEYDQVLFLLDPKG